MEPTYLALAVDDGAGFVYVLSFKYHVNVAEDMVALRLDKGIFEAMGYHVTTRSVY